MSADPPAVYIFVGSKKSDQPVVEESGIYTIFEKVGVEHHLCTASAHRNLGRLTKILIRLPKNSICIAAAGMAAALPGVIKATRRDCTVIAVALVAGDAFDGLDALLSEARMPPGVPLAVTGIGKPGLINAAWLALELLGRDSEDLARIVDAYWQEQNPQAEMDGKPI